jgi:hypothetical protein
MGSQMPLYFGAAFPLSAAAALPAARLRGAVCPEELAGVTASKTATIPSAHAKLALKHFMMHLP